MPAPLILAGARALAGRAATGLVADPRSRGCILGCGGCLIALALLCIVAVAAICSVVVAIPSAASWAPPTALGGTPPDGASSPPVMCGQLYASQGFGETPYEHPHTGIDLVCPPGTAVTAVRNGVFHQRLGPPLPCSFPPGARGGLGMYGELDAENGAFIYGHLAAFAVPDGSPVTAGEVLAFEGDTGCSSGAHLHFEVRIAGVPTNPCPFLPSGYPARHDLLDAHCWGSAPP